MTCVVDGGDGAARHHHRRRPAAAHGARRRHPRPDRRRRDDARSGDRAADHARRRGAEHHGAAQDHVDRRRQRRWPQRVAGVVHLHDLWRMRRCSDVRATGRTRAELVNERAARIRLMLFDVDGVLTDGTVLLHADGTESKPFDIKDGTAIVWAQRARADGRAPVGAHVGGDQRSAPRSSASRSCIRACASKLRHVRSDRRRACMLDDEQVAYMGDDVARSAGAGARRPVGGAGRRGRRRFGARVHWVSRAAAATGAARELIELILRAQGRVGLAARVLSRRRRRSQQA